MTTILDKPNQIAAYRLACQIAAIKLEGIGLKSRGGSMLARCKRHYNLKGHRKSIIEQMTKLKEQTLASK